MSMIFTPFKVETIAGIFSLDLSQNQHLNPLLLQNYKKSDGSSAGIKSEKFLMQVGATFGVGII
jgi:hypothetical protein